MTTNSTLSQNRPDSAFAIFAGGCFWCTEAVFSSLKGVYSVTSGYAGGSVKNPSYEQVHDGNIYQPYCQLVIAPKLEKFEKRFAELLKK